VLRNPFQIFINDESGQGITEYGALIAFVSFLIGLVFTITQGQLCATISNSFSALSSELVGLSSAAS